MLQLKIKPEEIEDVRSYFHENTVLTLGELKFLPIHFSDLSNNGVLNMLSYIVNLEKSVKIITCFPQSAKILYPELAEFIFGDWDEATISCTFSNSEGLLKEFVVCSQSEFDEYTDHSYTL